MPRLLALVLASASLATLACDRGPSEAPAASGDPEPGAKAPTPATEASAAPAPSPGPAPVPFEAEDGSYGYRDASGEVVIAPKWMLANPFEDQVAGVCGDEGCAFIDRRGEVLGKPFMFDNGPDAFVEGRARIIDGPADQPKFGFLASSGEIVVAPKWAFALPYSGGFAAVCEGCTRETDGEHSRYVGGKWGYVDADGELVIPTQYDEAGPFTAGEATVVVDGSSTTITAPAN